MTDTPGVTAPKIIALDEEGFFILAGDVRLADPKEGKALLKNLFMDEHGGCWTTWDGETLLVEPFDKPLVAQQIGKTANEIHLIAPYGFQTAIRLESMCLDDWDRFHGREIPNQFRTNLVNPFHHPKVERCFGLIGKDVVDKLLFILILK